MCSCEYVSLQPQNPLLNWDFRITHTRVATPTIYQKATEKRHNNDDKDEDHKHDDHKDEDHKDDVHKDEDHKDEVHKDEGLHHWSVSKSLHL